MKRATPIGGLPFWALLYAVVGLPVVDEASERPLGLQVDLIELSLEELMAVEVTSVPRKAQPASDGAALGTKLEHYTHHQQLELQPSARLLWKSTGTQSVLTAVSRALRTPSRSEEAGRIQGLGGLLGGPLAGSVPPRLLGLPVETQLWGSDQFGEESLVAYEGAIALKPPSCCVSTQRSSTTTTDPGRRV